MTSDLKSRIESGDLHFLDGLVLLGTIASQRWFGGKSKDVLDARVLDAGVAPGEPPILAIAIVEVRYGLQTHELYHLPLGFRPSADSWKQSAVAETEGWVAYDAIADPELARRIFDLMRTGATLETAEATIVFRSTGDLPAEVETARPMGSEQSNSSLVLDERYALKLYRRIAPGMNPELEMLRFLTERGFEHTAALEGYVAYEGRPLEATLALLQEFVPAKGDGWELALDSLERGEPDWIPEHARRLGEVTALLHNALASDPADPHFAPEDPSTEALALLSASVDEEIEHVFTALPDSPALEQVRGRGEEVRDHLRLLTNIGHVGRVIRTHGDYHLAQALWTSEGDWLILDFEGEPARAVTGAAAQDLAAARRCGDAALFRVCRIRCQDPARRRSTRRDGRSAAGRCSSTATSTRSSRRSCRRPATRSSGCWRCSSSRRRSTSSATSCTTGPTGSRSRWRESCRMLEQ